MGSRIFPDQCRPRAQTLSTSYLRPKASLNTTINILIVLNNVKFQLHKIYLLIFITVKLVTFFLKLCCFEIEGSER